MFRMEEMNRINEAAETLAYEAFELGIDSVVAELRSAPTALQFASLYYSKNTPIVVRNLAKDWRAVNKWSPEYFQQILGEKVVDVAVTPNGLADGIAEHNGEEYFVQPAVEKMRMSTFLQHLNDRESDAVYYIQKQNSNLSFDFPELIYDIDPSVFEFAEKVFLKAPDAINLWMGDSRAVTSMHKDPYDNLYFVISGHKDFILLPPHQLPFVPRKMYKSGVYRRNANGEFDIIPIPQDDAEMEDECAEVPPELTEWVAIDPLYPDLVKYPKYASARPIHVRVNAGDMLYLPNYWYHHVRQSHQCIAVNLWYDMDYDSRYCYFRMLEELFPPQNGNK